MKQAQPAPSVMLADDGAAALPLVEAAETDAIGDRSVGARTVKATRGPAAASVAHGALALFSAQPLTWAATIATTIFVPHYLGAAGLGTFAVAVTGAGLLATLLALGLPNHLVRCGATEPERAAREAAGAVVLVAASSMAVAAGILLTSPFLHLPLPADVLHLALVGMLIGSLIPIFNGLLLGREHHSRYAWLNAFTVAASAAGGILLLVLGRGLLGVMVASVCAQLAQLVVVWRTSGVRLRRESFRPAFHLHLVRLGLPFLGSNVTIQVRNQIDVVLTGLLLTQATAGWLAAAYRIITVPLFIPTLITTPLLPALSRAAADIAEFRRVLQRSLTAALLLAIPCAAGIVALAPAVPHVMHWPGEFSHSIPLMRILAFQQPLMAADMVLGTGLIALNKERPWLKVLVVGAMFNPCLNMIFLPLCNIWFHNGAIGAAFVEVATELVMFIGALLLLPAGMVDRRTWKLIGRAVAGGAALCLVASFLQERAVPLAIVAGGLVYLAAILLLRALQPADVQDLWRVMTEERRRRAAGALD